MKPLLYSERNAKSKGVGWTRQGHHIRSEITHNLYFLFAHVFKKGNPLTRSYHTLHTGNLFL